jgi:hypothetical protein
MTIRAVPTVILIAALAAASAGAASAQVSTTRGWGLGFQLVGASLNVEGEGENGGGGVGLRAGYGLNRIVTLFVALDGLTIETDGAPEEVAGEWRMSHADVGARFHFANSLRRWVPFLEAAAGGRWVSLEDADVDGEPRVDATLGGGLAVYLRQTLALEGDVRFTGGEITDIDLGAVSFEGLELDATTVRLGIGLTWWP